MFDFNEVQFDRQSDSSFSAEYVYAEEDIRGEYPFQFLAGLIEAKTTLQALAKATRSYGSKYLSDDGMRVTFKGDDIAREEVERIYEQILAGHEPAPNAEQAEQLSRARAEEARIAEWRRGMPDLWVGRIMYVDAWVALMRVGIYSIDKVQAECHAGDARRREWLTTPAGKAWTAAQEVEAPEVIQARLEAARLEAERQEARAALLATMDADTRALLGV